MNQNISRRKFGIAILASVATAATGTACSSQDESKKAKLVSPTSKARVTFLRTTNGLALANGQNIKDLIKEAKGDFTKADSGPVIYYWQSTLDSQGEPNKPELSPSMDVKEQDGIYIIDRKREGDEFLGNIMTSVDQADSNFDSTLVSYATHITNDSAEATAFALYWSRLREGGANGQSAFASFTTPTSSKVYSFDANGTLSELDPNGGDTKEFKFNSDPMKIDKPQHVAEFDLLSDPSVEGVAIVNAQGSVMVLELNSI